MSDIQQVAIIEKRTILGTAYSIVNPSAVQKGGVFDQIESDSHENIKFSRYQRGSGEFSDCQHLFVYSKEHGTQRDLSSALQDELERSTLNPRQTSLDDIRARLSNAGYNVSKVVTPKETTPNGKKEKDTGRGAGSEYIKPECAGCLGYHFCYNPILNKTPESEVSSGASCGRTSSRDSRRGGIIIEVIIDASSGSGARTTLSKEEHDRLFASIPSVDISFFLDDDD